ncbi:ATP-binding cassette transporter abc4 [Psilocybe cubensis]|uniref:P-loop containing nucleoside triphosphate hydrolase protein n=2 Tax=Psilocybe cubensis TaxID=181762 RepID=A0A8H8CFI0_PSICU|nr:ATP-binding cassette transporter abc4 [Psilocybe cubensis]KAH9475153.1 ATP-binding cassette transporter abc4 [Psilocybe cubensis]
MGEVSQRFGYQNPLLYPYMAIQANPIISIKEEIRVVPFLLTCALFSIQVIHFFLKKFQKRSDTNEDEDEITAETTSPGLVTRLKKHAKSFGGNTIYTFYFARFVGSAALFVLSVITSLKCQPDRLGWTDVKGRFDECPELFLTVTYLYSTFLSIVSLTSKAYGKWATRTNIVILLSALGVYIYRDLWPLATYDQRPADESEGAVLVYKIIILAFTGVVIPMFIPRIYTPIDPNDPESVPNPEQTASLFSMITYTFLDSTILLGYKVPHLKAEQLDPLTDRDRAQYRTKKAFPHLDIFHGAKRRSLFWGLMRVYRKEYIILAISVIFYSLGGFAVPIGINRVLYYMETNGEGATIRPWFWILWLFAGPLIQSFSFQWYIFIATRTLVRAEGLITQLVFEHSLRIRMKAETKDQAVQQQSSTLGTPTDSAVVTPDNASAITDAESEQTEAAHSQNSTVVAVSRETSSASTLRAAKEPAKGKTSTESKASAEESKGSDSDNLVGKINNLVTTDLGNITNARDFLMIILYIPVQITFCMIFLYQVLGWSSLVGVSVMIVLLPVPGYFASLLQKAQVQRMKKTDARIQAVTETVGILRMIKLFGWEQKMSDRLEKTREEELKWLWKLKLLDNLNGLLGFLYPMLTMLASYSLYTLVMKETLTPSKIFSSISVFNMLREQFYRLLRQGVDLIQGKVSLERVQNFLYETELLDAYLDTPSTPVPEVPVSIETSSEIGFRNATFTWSLDGEDGTMTPSRRQFKLRIKDELIFRKNCINLIIGPTGSGKTSILMALLGEMHFVASNPDSWFNLPRDGGIAYAAQESWVQNDTIKNNILFRTPLDEERYKKVIKQCALERDLELFEAGDATEVGERGLTLSGGQKARITLARAIYSEAEIILLDDIFAALDVHTATWIVENCFKGDLIKDRTILLVTHNIALASPIADFVVSIGSDGRIKSQGIKVSTALKRNPALAAEAKHDKEVIENAQTEIVETETVPKKPSGDGKLVIAEEIAEGHVTWKSIMLLIRSIGGKHPFVYYTVILTVLILVEFMVTFQTWYLGHWGQQYVGRDPSTVNAAYYINVYTAIAMVAWFTNFAVYMLFVIGSLRASKTINKLLMDSVLGSTLRWLDETPTARIITRCTQDIRTIDSQLPQNGMWLVDCMVGLTTKLGAVVIFTPIFLFPGLGVGAIGFYLGNMYLRAQLSVKRETSNARSPMLSHFSAAIHGIVSIRAYGAQELFKQESMNRINHYTRVARMSYNLNRWIGVRMDFLGALFTSALALYLIYGPNIGASNTGFSLSMASDLTLFILYVVRLGNEFEVNSNSLERIQSYLEIEHEPKSTPAGQPPAAWPTSGDLRVEHLNARYSQNGPRVLNDVSFHVESGQRVGIVGRTGSGKSSLTLALLRCILTEGTVYYDGIPTNTINLDALRSNITIIPQTPELLSGTLRQNLDPFDQNDDATLNDALRSAGLFSLQEEADEGRLTLDSVISGGGTNLSVGQRQIIALARAMVRGSKLLILDEATSAIDYKTDSIIQNTLRTELGGDVTVITVAHRLQTIMDSDRIIVLDNGQMAEFGKPKELLGNKSGILRALVDGSGDKETLYSLAGHADTD